MGHPRPRLSVFSRQLLVRRVAGGWPVAHVAEQLGISRATAYKWVRRYRVEGERGLLDRSSRPHRSPRQLSNAAEAEILAARARWRYGPDRLGPLLGRPPSTVHRVLARRGFSRLRDADRVTAAPVRYVACHPGALLHQDHKKLGRIPDGGGWRAVGREKRRYPEHRTTGYEHLEVIVDDASRYAVVVPVLNETAASAIGALEVAAAEFARLGIRIERVLTDNGTGYDGQLMDLVITGAGLIAMWIWALWGYMMRSARTVAFLTVLTIAVGLSFLLMSPVAVAVRIALLIGAAIALASLASAFVALPREVRRYDAVYSGAMRRLAELGERRLGGELTPEEALVRLEILEAQVSANVPPDDQWRRLHDQTVAYLRSQRNLYQQALTGVPVPDAALEQSRGTGMALVEDHHRLRRASRTFGNAGDLFG